MLVTLYGMIEEHNTWSQEAISEEYQSEEAPFTDKIQEIETALAPPTIKYIRGRSRNSSNLYS
ncbi:MAG: hypothetical protein U5K71_08925 [Gracilimonas sp.]|nr:hypothetical protein [Gracilimonas sp.]